MTLEQLKEHFGEKKSKRSKIYIDILSYAVHRNSWPNWKIRIYTKALQVSYWMKQDPVDFCKSLIGGQSPEKLETYLDYQLSKFAFDMYYGGSRDKRNHKLEQWEDNVV